MGKTAIEWATDVWNPVTGCTKVSQGCKNCYAKTLHDLRHQAYLDGKMVPRQYWVKFEEVQVHPERLEDPLKWRKPKRIFVNSMGDLFHEKVSLWFIARVFASMAVAKQHTFLVLTKRPHIMQGLLGNPAWADEVQTMVWSIKSAELIDWPLPNVWLGVSAEDQKTADERIPLLLQTPAAVRFVSCEPLLGPVEISKYLAPFMTIHIEPGAQPETLNALAQLGRAAYKQFCDEGLLDWTIAGGESGPGARPMHPDWARSLRDQCQAAGVPFFFKQWGEWLHENQIWKDPIGAPSPENVIHPRAEHFLLWNHEEDLADLGYQFEDRSIAYRTGRKTAGRLLDGREWNEFPEGKR